MTRVTPTADEAHVQGHGTSRAAAAVGRRCHDAPMLMLTWQSPPDGALGWQVDSALVDLGADGMSATGTQLAVAPLPYRLEWALGTDPGLLTRRLTVWAQGEGWSRLLRLTRDSASRWSCDAQVTGEVDLADPGGDTELLTGALDCDLGRWPLTNTMPVRRHRLHERAGESDFLMAWVSVPDLRVLPSPQRYTHLAVDGPGRSRVRYTSRDGDFTADLTVDRDALVIDYPGLGRRVSPGSP